MANFLENYFLSWVNQVNIKGINYQGLQDLFINVQFIHSYFYPFKMNFL
jgi:hypothetical protein